MTENPHMDRVGACGARGRRKHGLSRAGTVMALALSSLCGLQGAWAAEADQPEQIAVTVRNASLSAGLLYVEWETAMDYRCAGFNVYAGTKGEQEKRLLNDDLLPALLTGENAGRYRFQTLASLLPAETDSIVIDAVGLRGLVQGRAETGLEDSLHPVLPTVAKSDLTSFDRSSLKINAKRYLSTLSDPAVDNASGDRIKVITGESGIYRVPSSEIAAALQVSSNTVADWLSSGYIAISNSGHSVAWTADGDGMLFYAECVDTLYADRNTYWIHGGEPGQIMSIRAGTALPAVQGSIFRESAHFETQAFPQPAYFRDLDDDFWIWDYIIAGNATYGKWRLNLSLPGFVGTSGTVDVAVHLLGATDTAAAIDHHVRIHVNGSLIAEAQWAGTTFTTVNTGFSASLLNGLTDELVIEGLLDSGVPYSYVYIDSIDVSYDRRATASSDRLYVHDCAEPAITASGFSKSNISVFDVSTPALPVVVSALEVSGDTNDFATTFINDGGESSYAIAADDAYLAPLRMEAVTLRGLATTVNGAQYLVITPAEFLEQAKRLVRYRQEQGLSSMSVDVDDIYNEFSDGVPHVDALRDFIRYAHANWNTPPCYVVILGKGSFDFRDFSGNGDCLVPPYPLVCGGEGILFCDTRMGDTDGDGCPEVAIGRLPAMTAAELSGMIDKIEYYEVGGNWKNMVRCVADNPDGAGDFDALSEAVIERLPSGVGAERVYLSSLGLAATRTQTLSGLNEGCGILNYIGHGYITKLAGEGILRIDDIDGLHNATNAPIITAFACDVGIYALTGTDTLSESLLANANGAVAVWGCVGLAWSSQSRILNESFMDAAFGGPVTRLGDACLLATAAYHNQNSNTTVPYKQNLLGDPATLIIARTPMLALIESLCAVQVKDGLAISWRARNPEGMIMFKLQRADGDAGYSDVESVPEFHCATYTYTAMDPLWDGRPLVQYRLVEMESGGSEVLHGPYDIDVEYANPDYREWLIRTFGDELLVQPGVAAWNVDADGDGHTTLQEYVAGTDPSRADSTFAVTSMLLSDSGLMISWSSESNRIYSVESIDPVTAAAGTLCAGLVATPPINVYTVTMHNATRAILRLRVHDERPETTFDN